VLGSLLRCPVYLLHCFRLDGEYRLGMELFAEEIRPSRLNQRRTYASEAQRFADRLSAPSSRLVERLREAPSNLTLIALILIILIVISSKALTRRGTPLSGGLPSGHAALAFGGFTAITFIVEEQRVVVAFVALIMALLVAQTRVEAGIHTTTEVVLGAVIGTLVTMILFQVLA
jgi:hypothetical protein